MSESVGLNQRRSVLLVDDSDMERFIAREALEQVGFSVVEARNGNEGVEQFSRLLPDLVLLDVKMPELDGFGACAQIRALPEGAHTPILMLTGLDDVDSINRAYEEGASDFFTKPLNTTMLQHRVKYLLRAKLTADALRESQAELAKAQKIARLGHWQSSVGSPEVQWSPDVEQMFGGSLVADGGVIGALAPFLEDEDRARLQKALTRVVQTGQAADLEHRVIVPGHPGRVVHHTIDPTPDPSGRVERLVGAIQDISERREAEDRIRRLAYYDAVTNLPNRTLFSELLTRVIALARRHDRVVALLFLDLDHFKRINDTLGHSAGDELLREVARRLGECVRGCDFMMRAVSAAHDEDTPVEQTVARLGGDEFVVLLPEVRDPEDAAVVASRMGEALNCPMYIDGREIHMTGSIGISCFPMDGDDLETLLKHADSAMYHAKSEGRNRYQFYTPSMNARALERLSMEVSLRKAIEDDEFILHYQPIVATDSGEVRAMEALVRWQTAETGLVSPAAFIPVAEETGLIVPLGRLVLRSACEQAQRWVAQGVFDGRVSVNLSAAQFRHPSLNADIAQALQDSGLAPERLQLELTESMLMHDSRDTTRLLDELKSLGVYIAIDDFGTGYSSLSYLKYFPIDVLKIDQSFIRDLVVDQNDAAIVAATVMLGKALHLQVVAEGVEETSQLDYLRNLRCDECQGYLFSRPLPANEFVEWMAQHRIRAAKIHSAAHPLVTALPG